MLLLMKRDGESHASLPCGSFKGQYVRPPPPLLLQQSVFSNAACPRGRRIMRSRDPADHHGHCSVSRKHTQEQQQTTTTFVFKHRSESEKVVFGRMFLFLRVVSESKCVITLLWSSYDLSQGTMYKNKPHWFLFPPKNQRRRR